MWFFQCSFLPVLLTISCWVVWVGCTGFGRPYFALSLSQVAYCNFPVFYICNEHSLCGSYCDSSIGS